MASSLYLVKRGTCDIASGGSPIYSSLTPFKFLEIKNRLEILGVIITDCNEKYAITDGTTLTKIKMIDKDNLFINNDRLCVYRYNNSGTKIIIEEVHPGKDVIFEMDKLIINNDTDYNKPVQPTGERRASYKQYDDNAISSLNKWLPDLRTNIRGEFVTQRISSVKGDFFTEISVVNTINILDRSLISMHTIDIKT